MGLKDRHRDEPAELVIASQEATYTYAGHLEDGTKAVRDSDGRLWALVPVSRVCDHAAIR